MTPWIPIAIGGLFETVWASFLNMSDGLSNIVYVVLAVAFTFVSVAFLKIGLRLGAPVGNGYAVWVGFGAVFSALVGTLFFGEVLSPAGWVFFCILIAGVLLLQSAEEEK